MGEKDNVFGIPWDEKRIFSGLKAYLQQPQTGPIAI
jgi:hypothetical protein